MDLTISLFSVGHVLGTGYVDNVRLVSNRVKTYIHIYSSWSKKYACALLCSEDFIGN